MKKRTKTAAIMCLGLLLIGQVLPVSAAGKTEIALQAGPIEENSEVQISCGIDSASGITSGKLRIHYDSEQLTLMSVSADTALSNALCQINDPVTGNREPGEIILAFASAQPIEQRGTMLEMEFRVSDHLKEGDTVNVTAEAEQLAGDDGDVEVEMIPAAVTVGQNSENPPTKPEDPDDPKTPENPTEPAEPVNPSTPDGDSNKAGGSDSGKSKKSVKTGDTVNVVIPLLGIGGAGAVLAVILYKRKKA